MSDHGPQEIKPEYFDYKHVGGRLLGVGLLAIISLLGCLVWGYFDSEQFAFSYLFAFYYFLTLCMGGLFWTLVHHGFDCEWSVVVRRQLENVANLLPIMAVLFLPLIFVAPILWHWMVVPAGQDIVLDEKAAYLNKPFFWIRAVAYFAYFGLAAYLLKRFSVKQDADGDPKYTIFSRRVTMPGAILFAVCLTFSAVDWLMGLDYHWFSTMWGVYIFAGTALSSMCVLVLVITGLQKVGYLKNVVTVEHYHIMGKLMLAFTVFWAYIGFSQYMLIWYANIPEETVYFLRRNTENWNLLNIIMVIGHFWLPFVLLLPQATKRNPRILCAIACWILVMHLLDMYIIVMPTLHQANVHPSWLDLLCVVAIGSTLIAVFLKRLGDTPLSPVKDPRLQASIRLLN
ncbi:MAG: hypothetical protein ACK5LK_00335 [Chthoniobacterales bacterium]